MAVKRDRSRVAVSADAHPGRGVIAVRCWPSEPWTARRRLWLRPVIPDRDRMRPALRWRMADVEIAFSEIADGDARSSDRRDRFLERVGCPLPSVAPRQVHGAGIVDAAATPDLMNADGVVTQDDGIALVAFGADCPGLVLSASDALVVAHCGWRGTAAGILTAAVSALSTRTAVPRNAWSAFIGPGICGAHYEVDAPVLGARAWPASALSRQRAQHARLDLATVIVHDLLSMGIVDIRRSGICTAEDDRLWSYRGRGQGVVQALVAWRAPRALSADGDGP